MKSKLQRKLILEFPQFFATDQQIYIGDNPMMEEVDELLNQKKIVLPIQFGFECGDGWFMILEELMSEIQNHIENENRNRDNEFKYKWMWKVQYWFRMKGYPKFSDWIYEHAPRGRRPPISINIGQIKEKFGGLRFYYSGGDNSIGGMVFLAERLSYKICETCGSTKNVTQTEGWIKTLCEDCMTKIKKNENI
jgi:hypothetical protein